MFEMCDKIFWLNQQFLANQSETLANENWRKFSGAITFKEINL